MHGKWRRNRGGVAKVSGHNASGEYVQTFDVADVQPASENQSLRYLWARSRIDDLSYSSLGQRGDTPDVEDEITAFGLGYNLLTRYTSFIAVLEQIRNEGAPASDVKQPLPLPLGVSELAVGGQVQSGAEPELIVLVACMFMVLIFASGKKRLSAWQ